MSPGHSLKIRWVLKIMSIDFPAENMQQSLNCIIIVAGNNVSVVKSGNSVSVVKFAENIQQSLNCIIIRAGSSYHVVFMR